MNRWAYQFAASVLRAGGVIAYPTEAVWGLGCDPLNEVAVLRLLALKRRPMHKGVILIASDIGQVEPFFGNITRTQRRQLEQTWPGFQTWIIPAGKLVPDWITGRHSGFAVRVSNHPQVRNLCDHFGGPIVSTSANYAGRPAAKTRVRLATYFNRQLDYVVPGNPGGQANPSPIIDLCTGVQLR